MNRIHAHKGISRSEIIKPRYTTSGEEYTLDHPSELIVSMRYTPMASKYKKNTQGWELDAKAYWAEISERCPQCLDYRNRDRIAKGKSPRVNKAFSDHFPQYKKFNQQTLYHHHIGGNGDAVAVPSKLHVGYGEIHNIEKQLTIRDNAERFTTECRRLYAKNQKLYGKKSIEFQKILSLKRDQFKNASNSRVDKSSLAASNESLTNKQVDTKKNERNRY